jgi:Tfp pilus assembly protein PilP
MPSRAASALTVIALASVASGCSNPPAAPIPVTPIPVRPVAAATPATVTPPVVNPLEGMADLPNYEAKGRRDPFEVYEVREGSGGLMVSSTRLTGIVRNARSALALLEAPDGIGYIVRPGDTLGDGTLTDIGLDSVVFAVAAKPGAPATRVVLRLLGN